MVEIKRIERYKLRGNEYASLKQIQDHVQNKIGLIVDKMDVTLTPKQKLNILQVIIDNKEALKVQLDVCIDLKHDDPLYSSMKNILDMEV